MYQQKDKIASFKGQSYSGKIDCTGITELICDFGSARGNYADINQLLDVFTNVSSIEILSLNFWNCNLDSFINFLTKFVSEFTHLKDFSISVWTCRLGDEGLIEVSQVIKTLKGITKLYIDFRWNQVKDTGFEELGTAIGQLTQLQSLQIEGSNNLITHKSMVLFGTAIANLQELKNFDLVFESNEMQSVGIQYLAEGVKNCQKLTDISLNFRNNLIKNNENLRKACQVLSKCSQFVNSKFDFIQKNQNNSETLYKNELLKLQRNVLLEFETEKNKNEN